MTSAQCEWSGSAGYLWTCSHHIAVLKHENKNTDMVMILA